VVVEAGPKTEMFQPPHDPYTELLLSVEMDPDWLSEWRRAPKGA
jgi:peptide/nickel transport system ATP-binding protein